MDGKLVSNQTTASELAQALMLGQVEFIKKQLLEHKNSPHLKQFIHQIFIQANQIQLNEIILLEHLNEVVKKYAFDLNLGAELLEFIGFVAQKIHQLIIANHSTINSLISDQTFETWLYKILELEQARTYLEQNISQNPKAQLISLNLANQILETNTPWLDHLRKLNIKQHGISAKLISFVQEQQQTVELKLEKQLAQVILKQLSYIITLPSEEMAEISLDIWSEVKTKTFKDSFSQIQSIDLEDFFILVYETWKELRETPQMQSIILSVVSSFYDYFGEFSLQALLLAVGIDESDLYEEADRFIPSTMQALADKNLLDPMILSLIEPYFSQLQTQQLIQQHLTNHNQSN